MDPHALAVFTVSGKNKHMIPSASVVIHQESQITGQKLFGGNGIGFVPLTPGGTVQADADSRFIGPIRKAGAIQTERADRAGRCGTGGCNEFWRIPFIIPSGCRFSAPEVWHLPDEGQPGFDNVLSCFAAILTGEEGNQFYIGKRNGAAVSGCSV